MFSMGFCTAVRKSLQSVQRYGLKFYKKIVQSQALVYRFAKSPDDASSPDSGLGCRTLISTPLNNWEDFNVE